METEREFAFALCPNIAGRLLEQIDQDEETKKIVQLQKETNLIEAQLRKELSFAQSIDDSSSKAFTELIEKVFDPYKNEEHASRPIVHHIPATSVNKISRIIIEIAPRAAKRVENLMLKYERNHSKLSKIRKSLDKAPQDELVQPTITLLSQLNRDLGKLQEKRIELNQLKRLRLLTF